MQQLWWLKVVDIGILSILSRQDMERRRMSLRWLGLFAIACAGTGAERGIWERILALVPGLIFALAAVCFPESVGEGDAVLAGSLGLAFSFSACCAITSTALAAGAAAGAFLVPAGKEDSFPFAPALLLSWLLWLPVI